MSIDFVHRPSETAPPQPPVERVDVVIVGAGLSGVGAACHLKSKCPEKRVVILEARHAIGGTWDLFRYPGVRSDSDMSTFGYGFRPWNEPKAIADGASIARYIRDTAEQHGVDRLIRFGCRLVRASWRTNDAVWTREAKREDGSDVRVACDFLYMCTGYYEYAKGYTPDWPDMGRFRGRTGPGDRQRGDRGDARSGADLDRGACGDASALADLCRVPPERRRAGDRLLARQAEGRHIPVGGDAKTIAPVERLAAASYTAVLSRLMTPQWD
jgi:hypothetical protein